MFNGTEKFKFTHEILDKAEDLHASVHPPMPWEIVARILGCPSWKSLQVTLCERRQGRWGAQRNDRYRLNNEELVNLFLEEGMSITEIARIKDVPRRVVKYHLLSVGVDKEVREELKHAVWVP